MRPEAEGRTWSEGRGGFVLPLVLLLLPTFLALGMAAFSLAHGQLALAGLDQRLVEELVASRPPSAQVPAPGELPLFLGVGGGGGGDGASPPAEVPPGSFHLLTAAPGPLAGSRRGYRVVWVPNPPAMAGDWARSGVGPAELGPIPLTRLLAQVSEGATGDGEMGGEGGGGEGATDWDGAGEWLLRGGHHVAAPGGWLLLLEGEGVVLLAPGGVRVSGLEPLSALILAGGEVALLGEMELRGGVRAAEGLRMDPGARLTPDSAALHRALLHSPFVGPHLLPGGEHLGRF